MTSQTDELAATRGLVDRITRVTGLPQQTVITHLLNEQDEMGSTVRSELKRREIEPYVWSEKLVGFYRDSHAMLFETIIWNRTPNKAGVRKFALDFLSLDNNEPKRILTFGDGLGFDSLALAQAGHQVDYYEVAENAIRFASDQFSAAGVKIGMINSPAELAANHYDAVICLDVLEHVPDPCEVVDFLVPALRPNGHLIVHAPFYLLSPAVQTHLRSNRQFSGDLKRLYQRAGLKPVDGAVFWNPLILEKTDGAKPLAKYRWAAWARISTGKLLLFAGRFWAFPYSVFSKLANDRSAWPELLALEQEYKAADRTSG